MLDLGMAKFYEKSVFKTMNFVENPVVKQESLWKFLL